jgi:formylmethanofuran dehydrogenase subunit E
MSSPKLSEMLVYKCAVCGYPTYEDDVYNLDDLKVCEKCYNHAVFKSGEKNDIN